VTQSDLLKSKETVTCLLAYRGKQERF